MAGGSHTSIAIGSARLGSVAVSGVGNDRPRHNYSGRQLHPVLLARPSTIDQQHMTGY